MAERKYPAWAVRSYRGYVLCGVKGASKALHIPEATSPIESKNLRLVTKRATGDLRGMKKLGFPNCKVVIEARTAGRRGRWIELQTLNGSRR